eukprot:jgi/Picre1/28637/NNA_004037.t1
MFGKAPAGVLPFEPPSFIRKITQRGLEDAAPNEFSPFFIFMLCQGSVKVLVTKMFGWGPTLKCPCSNQIWKRFSKPHNSNNIYIYTSIARYRRRRTL